VYSLKRLTSNTHASTISSRRHSPLPILSPQMAVFVVSVALGITLLVLLAVAGAMRWRRSWLRRGYTSVASDDAGGPVVENWPQPRDKAEPWFDEVGTCYAGGGGGALG